MANLKYTFSDLQKAVTHVLGGAPDSNVTVSELVNGALWQLCTIEPWRWKQRALSVSMVNAQSYVALPGDFQEIVTIKKVGDTSGTVEPVSLDRIIDARQQGATVTAGLWYALSWNTQGSVTTLPTPILELYPTPGVTPGSLAGIYLCRIPLLSAGTDVPNIPEDYHELLKTWCRAYAMQYETGQRGADWAMFTEMMAMAIRLDGRSVGDLGRYRGGIRPMTAPSLASQTQSVGA